MQLINNIARLPISASLFPPPNDLKRHSEIPTDVLNNLRDYRLLFQSEATQRPAYQVPKYDQRAPVRGLRLNGESSVDLIASAKEIEMEYGLTPIASMLLASRGKFAGAELRRFLSSTVKEEFKDVDNLIDFGRACEVIGKAILGDKRIVLYGDMDADGICSTSILFHLLNWHGITPVVLHSDRFATGHGILATRVRQLGLQSGDIFIAMDHGSSQTELFAELQKKGVITGIIDHHKNPTAKATFHINPERKDCKFGEQVPASILSFAVAVGTAKWMRREEHRGDNANNQKKSTLTKSHFDDLKALATIGALADVCDLSSYRVRALVREGIEALKTCKLPGVNELVSATKVELFNTDSLLFALIPAINAPPRMLDPTKGDESGPAIVAKLINTSRSDEKLDRTEIHVLAKQIVAINEDVRKVAEAEQLPIAEEQAEALLKQNPKRRMIAIFDKRFHAGIIGLLAARLKDKFRCSIAVATLGAGGDIVVSYRTEDDIDCETLLVDPSVHDIQISGGGHARAGGQRLALEYKSAWLQAVHVVGERIAKESGIQIFEHADFIFPLAELQQEFRTIHDSFSPLAPFGHGFEAPKFFVPNLNVQSAARNNGLHLELQLGDIQYNSMPAFFFHRRKHSAIADEAECPYPGQINIIAKLLLSTWVDENSKKQKESRRLGITQAYYYRGEEHAPGRAITVTKPSFWYGSMPPSPGELPPMDKTNGYYLFQSVAPYSSQDFSEQMKDPAIYVAANPLEFDQIHRLVGIRRSGPGKIRHVIGQARIIQETLAAQASRESVAIEAGTSSGKTVLDVFLCAKELQNMGNVLVLTPTVALTKQVHSNISSKLDVEALSAATGKQITVELLSDEQTNTNLTGNKVIVAGPEKTLLAAKERGLDLGQFSAVIIDEETLLRGEGSVARLVASLPQNTWICLQSATVGKDEAQRAEFLKKINAKVINKYLTPGTNITPIETRIRLGAPYSRWNIALTSVLKIQAERILKHTRELSQKPQHADIRAVLSLAYNQFKKITTYSGGGFKRPVAGDLIAFEDWLSERISDYKKPADNKKRSVLIAIKFEMAQFGYLLSMHGALISYGPAAMAYRLLHTIHEFVKWRENGSISAESKNSANGEEKMRSFRYFGEVCRSKVFRKIAVEAVAKTPFEPIFEDFLDKMRIDSSLCTIEYLEKLYLQQLPESERSRKTRLQPRNRFLQYALQELSSTLHNDHPANEEIVKALTSDAMKGAEQVIVTGEDASDIKYIQEKFKDRLPAKMSNAAILIGKKHRSSLRLPGEQDHDGQLQEFRNGTRALLCGNSAARRGIDIAGIKYLLMLRAVAEGAELSQAFGRLGRGVLNGSTARKVVVHSFVIVGERERSESELRHFTGWESVKAREKQAQRSAHVICRPFFPCSWVSELPKEPSG